MISIGEPLISLFKDVVSYIEVLGRYFSDPYKQVEATVVDLLTIDIRPAY